MLTQVRLMLLVLAVGVRYLLYCRLLANVAPDGSGQRLQLTTSRTTADVMAKSGPYYTFPNAGVVADDAGWSRSNGGKVIGFAQNDGTNQQWSMP